MAQPTQGIHETDPIRRHALVLFREILSSIKAETCREIPSINFVPKRCYFPNRLSPRRLRTVKELPSPDGVCVCPAHDSRALHGRPSSLKRCNSSTWCCSSRQV